MAQRPTHVPKFGNWDANDNVPFTAVFDNARAGKGGRVINPNDPAENPAAFGLGSNDRSQEREGTRAPVWTSELEGRPARRQSGDAHGYRRPSSGSRGPSGDGENSGLESGPREPHSADQSPNHQGAYQGRLGNRPGSPFWERKNSPEGGNMLAPGTPGKSRLRPGSTRPDETPDRSPALPKFGAWDEKDPSSAEGFTVIFNQARNEKKAGGPVRIPALQGETPTHGDPHKPSNNLAGSKKNSSVDMVVLFWVKWGLIVWTGTRADLNTWFLKSCTWIFKFVGILPAVQARFCD